MALPKWSKSLDGVWAVHVTGCPKCENGVIEHMVPGSASKTEYSFCSCLIGQAAKANHDDALEAKGEERAR